MKLTLEEIAKAVEGRLIGDNAVVTAVSTDTRTISNGALFIPLKGASFDGHKFIDVAVENGAVAVISQEEVNTTVPVIMVEDTHKALGDLARYYRSIHKIPVVGITGSTGKTTTKDIVASVLAQKYNVLKTEGNFNNDIGVPLTLFRLEDDTECAVIEMGMNHFGEISYLTHIANPDMAVITNVGVSHIENLGSREGILKAKCEMFESMEDGYKVLNGDDDMLVTVKDKYKNVCYFSMNDKNAEVYAANIQPKGIEGISCTIHTKDVSFDVNIPVPGLHMVSNAMAATAIALKIGLNADEIKKGIESFVPTKMRMDIVKTDRYTIVNDVYNANPNSTKAGIDVVAPVEGKSCCILGDMLELGDFGPKLHSEVGQYAIEKNIDTLVCIGEISKSMYEGALSLRKENVYYFPTQEEFWDKMGNILEDGMTILIKASRGMHFEKTTERIKEIK